MCTPPTFRIQFTETNHETTSKTRNELFVGRSPAMNIIDNRISRKQLRFFMENGTTFVERIGLSESRKDDVTLEKNQTIPVKDGDKFTLFLDQYPFVLHVHEPAQSHTPPSYISPTIQSAPPPPLEPTFPSNFAPTVLRKHHSDHESSDAHNHTSDENEDEDDDGVIIISDESSYLGSSDQDSEKDSKKTSDPPVSKSGPARKKGPKKTLADEEKKKSRDRKANSEIVEPDDDRPVRRTRRSAKPKSDISAYRAYVKTTKPAVRNEYPNENDRHIAKLLKGRWERMTDEERKEFYGAGGRKED